MTKEYYEDIRATLIALSGNRNAIVVHRAFVEFTGSLEAAMMLGQLLYWTPRAEGEFIAKTCEDWAEELCLSQYAVRKARKELEGLDLLETQLKKWGSAPTVHYRLKMDNLIRKWNLWIRQMELLKSTNGIVEIDKSSIETTSEIIDIELEKALFLNPQNLNTTSPFKDALKSGNKTEARRVLGETTVDRLDIRLAEHLALDLLGLGREGWVERQRRLVSFMGQVCAWTDCKDEGRLKEFLAYIFDKKCPQSWYFKGRPFWQEPKKTKDFIGMAWGNFQASGDRMGLDRAKEDMQKRLAQLGIKVSDLGKVEEAEKEDGD